MTSRVSHSPQWYGNLGVPESWGTADPRPWTRTLGVLDILISTTGFFLLVCLELIVLDVRSELKFLRDNKGTITAARTLSDSSSHTLNATFSCACDCEAISGSIRNDLGTALASKRKIRYEVRLSRKELDAWKEHVFCEILITTNVDPYQTQGLASPIADMVKATIKPKVSKGFKLSIKQINQAISRKGGKSKKGKTQSDIKIDDPDKLACINRMKIDNEAEEDFDNMQTLMMAAAGCSILSGFLLIFSSFQAKLPLVIGIFFIELACIGVLVGALAILNRDSLCLLEYGGIDPAGDNSATNVQTKITIICAIYLILFKTLCLAAIVAFAIKIPKLKPDRRYTKFLKRFSRKSGREVDADTASMSSEKRREVKGILKSPDDVRGSVGSFTSAVSLASLATIGSDASKTSIRGDKR